MGQTPIEVAEERANTDASLDAERLNLDTDGMASAAVQRRSLDDLIERDRLRADEKLFKFRAGADRILSGERSRSPTPSVGVSSERESADARQTIERSMADAVLVGERHRSDIAVGAERDEHDALLSGLETLRHTTDDQLSTERHGADKTATALGETRRALAQAHTEQERRGDVLAMVSHDVRSPLTVISLSAETIGNLSRDNTIQTTASTITRAVARIERLASDLLDVARIDTGTLRIVRRRHDILDLLGDLRDSYETMFSARSIHFTVNIPNESMIVFFDYDRIVQVISNLLSNAMKFTPGGGCVTVGVERQDGHVVFAVQDTGDGIAPIDLPHVFERFWQIDTDTRRGLGLGLHICHKIVESHGGQIWAESELGTGSIFRFKLPVR